MKKTAFGLATALMLVPIATNADLVVDFETLPGGGTPADNSAAPVYTDPDSGVSVQFGFDNDGDNVIDEDAFIEQVGNSDPDIGFGNETVGVPDTASPGFEAELGDRFLRHPDFADGAPPTFLIDYAIPEGQIVTGVGGQIWDIDGIAATEQYLVEAFGFDGNLLATQTSPLGDTTGPGSLDGSPWEFSFSGLTEQIDRIAITFIGSKVTNVGLAFDNYSMTVEPLAVPEPSSLALLSLLGVGATIGKVTRRRKRKEAEILAAT